MGPLHDWTSHAADAFRYLAVGLQEPKAAKVEAEEDEFAWSGGYAQSWMG
jgi:hypothetical protein